ncbi:MAG TPA: outer membrane beta-barrel protein [Desulfobacterales bacterium]|nr:outer membrane beta-barrel protein [Desulfobacterales bacterium]
MNLKTTIHILIIAFLLLGSSAFGFQINFTPRITATEEYTDNLFLDPDHEEDDFITTISPGFTAEIAGRTRGAAISYDPAYVFYNEYNEFDGWRHSATFSAWQQMARNTRLEIEDAFLYTEDPVPDDEFISEFREEPLIEADTTIRRDRETYYTNAASFRLIHQFGASDSVYLGYVYGILRNDDPTYEDNDTHTPSVGLTYWFLPDWGVDTRAEYTKGQYSDTLDTGDLSDDLEAWEGSARLIKRFSRQFEGFAQYNHTYVDYKGDSEDYHVYEPSAGINYTLAEELILTLRAGYFIQDREESDGEEGVLLDGVLSKTWTFRRGSINAVGSSGYEHADFGAENLGFNRYYLGGLRAEYGFTRQFTGDVYGSYRRVKYTDIEETRTDKITETGLGISYQPWQWINMRLGYSFHTVDSTDDADEYDENRVLFTVTLSPANTIRFGR